MEFAKISLWVIQLNSVQLLIFYNFLLYYCITNNWYSWFSLIVECIGKKGDVDTETTAIFAELGLIKTPISASYNPYLPNFPYVITEEEIATRLDLRFVVLGIKLIC